MFYDTKGRFALHHITPEEAKCKLCKVRKIFVGTKGILHLATHMLAPSLPDPLIKVKDTIQIALEMDTFRIGVPFLVLAFTGSIIPSTIKNKHSESEHSCLALSFRETAFSLLS